MDRPHTRLGTKELVDLYARACLDGDQALHDEVLHEMEHRNALVPTLDALEAIGKALVARTSGAEA
jgi:hypothetical protein